MDLKRVVLICVLVGILVACGAQPEIRTKSNNEGLEIESEIVRMRGGYYERFIDRRAGVICYETSSGISCLPLADTLLPRG